MKLNNISNQKGKNIKISQNIIIECFYQRISFISVGELR